jgi:NTE family protein
MSVQPLSPVNSPDQQVEPVADVLSICLSGGGYRAMLFHTGALWRMLELGFLGNTGVQVTKPDGTQVNIPRIDKISSVSGGTIVSALLALEWAYIAPSTPNALDRYKERIVPRIRNMAKIALAGTSLEGAAKVIKDILLPGSVSEHVEAAYAEHLYGDKTLQDLPGHPFFVFNASNLQSGALWRFEKAFMRDYKVGQVKNPTLALAKAVAASSAFPPMLAPCLLKLDPGVVLDNDPAHPDPLSSRPYRTEVYLADGGVYDNLGLETAFKNSRSLLVSNAGAPFDPEESIHTNWVSIGKRCLDLMEQQLASLRTRLLIQNFKDGERQGAFWAISSDPTKFKCAVDPFKCDPKRTKQLAEISTDLDAKSTSVQERLINWGYAATDLSIRSNLHTGAPVPTGFPYPNAGV